jgi:hypothetical protein
MLGAVCSHEQVAVIPLRDAQLQDISVGTATRLHLPALGDEIWSSQVTAIVRLDQLDSVTRLMAESDDLSHSAQTKSSSTKLPADAGYAAIVPLPCQAADVNAEIRAVFTVQSKTVAQRTRTWLRANLRWLMP